ncbi:MAG: tetratricopeptide repeat protein, partial [Abditibacteriales bacterium]|nr:tetratricopeptide repeat protein [Abditibacteriales bacterium]MDW8365914.1 tetratricopeptide repeat protein [Abditibacteriales bacterium]
NINCELVCALVGMDVDLGLIPYEAHQFDESVDARYRAIAERLHRQPAHVHCHVRHLWPPNFERPARGAFILIQPWEFGFLPVDWVEGIARSVDEVWTHSHYVREVYLRSGVDPEKVQMIPLGVNPDLFHPDVPPFGEEVAHLFPVHPNDFKFLFVGGSIPRKGFDVLLQAYLEEFSADEEVCLVIKDFYYGGQGREQVKAAQQRPDAPRIVYWYGNIVARQLGGLYKACDAYVHPFRGEGTGLPILEAMACGLPVIVTDYGPTRDYCSEDTAYLVPAREVEIPPALWGNQFKTVHPPRWAEPDKDALRWQMRRVFTERDEARYKGLKASQHILSHYTWAHTARCMVERMRVWKAARRLTTGSKEQSDARHSFGRGESAVADILQRHSETAEVFLRRGRERLAAGDFAAAAAEFRRAAELEPQHAVAHNSLAFALFHLRRFDEALQHARRSAELDPSYAEAQHNIGALMKVQGQWAEAVRHLTRALELKPVYPEAAQMLIETLQIVGAARPSQPFPGVAAHRHERRQQKRRGVVVGISPSLLRRAQNALTQSRQAIQDLAEAMRRRDHPTLSLCMIVRNEEKFLPQCLESVQGAVDEIVVVDTGSTDSTIEIARRFGAKVFHYAWSDDFSAARNFALAQATGDWVLVLDADEKLEASDKPKLREAMRYAAQPGVNIGGYALPFRNYLEGEDSGTVILHYATRLFRRLPGVKFSGRIHEEATPSIYGLGLQVAFANILIHHYGYNASIVSARNKMERTYSLLFKQLEEEPDNPFHLYNLANTYQYDGKHAEALPYFEKAAALMKPDAFYAASVYNGWATCLYCVKRYHEAIEKCLISLRRQPDHPETHYTLGLNYNALGRHDEAIWHFEKAIAAGQTFAIGISDLSVSGYKAYFSIGQAYMAKKDYTRAIESFRRAVEMQPGFVPAQFHLGVMCAEVGRTEEAKAALECVLSREPAHIEACERLADLYAREGRLADAIALYERLLAENPDCEAAHCNLGNLLSAVDIERAIVHYRRALALNPQRAETHNNLGVALARCGELAQAEEHYLTALRLQPNYAEAHSNLGTLRFEQGNIDAALRAFQRAIAEKPDYLNAYLNLGDVLLQRAREAESATLSAADVERALECYEKAATLNPRHPLPFFKIGRLYLECNAPEAGILALQRAVQLDPHFTAAREQLEYVLKLQ